MSAVPSIELDPARHAAAYVRISDDRTGENASITRQRKLVTELAERHGIDGIVWYEDKSKSAAHGVRPAFAQLMADVRAGEVSQILVWVADRLWRNDDDRLDLAKGLAAAGVPVLAAQGNDLDFGSAEGHFMADVIGAASAFETRRKRERVTLAAADRARKGRFSGGVRRFGYAQRDTRVHRSMDDSGAVTEVLRPSGPLVLVPDEADAVASGYRQMMAGASLNAVTRDWRARGLTGVQGGPLTPMVVRQVLLRAANAGISTYKGEVVGTAEWPAIVDADTWATVKALLEDPSRRTNVGRPAVHLLSGILVCGGTLADGTVCGKPMRASSKSGGQTYRCGAGRQLPSSEGSHVSRRREKLDERISDLVVLHIEDNARALSRPRAGQSPAVGKAVQESAELRTRIESFQARATEFGPDDLAGILRGLRAKLAEVEKLITKAAGTPATHALVASGDVAVAWSKLDTLGKRAVIKENVDRIVVGPGLVGSRNAVMHGIDPQFREP